MCRSVVAAIILIANAASAELQTRWGAEWHHWAIGHTTLSAVQLSRIR